MKRIIPILLLLTTWILFAQTPVNAPVVQRAQPSNTVQDARLMAQFNMYMPRYLDTTAANVASNLGIDSCGAQIFTYDVNAFWVRACNPKRWERVSGTQVLPDGVFSGGDVYWTGTGLDHGVTPAIYILNGQILTSPLTILTLVPSDPVNDRIDLIGLGPTGPVVITGIPAPSPQEPSFNPQIFIRRAAVLVRAGALTPAIVTTIIYDENLGLPDEWTATNQGGTVDFANPLFPFHLTVDAFASVFDSSNRIKFNYSDTVNSMTRGSLVGFIRLTANLPVNQNIYIQLFNAGLPVSLALPITGYGVFRNVISQYQPFVIPLPAFGAANIVFDEIRIIPTGGGAFPQFRLDFIQFQSGFSPIVTQRDFAVVDNVAYGPRFFNQAGYPFNFNNGKIAFNTVTIPAHTLTFGDEINGNPILYIYGPQGDLAYLESPSDGASIEIRAKNTINFIPHLGSAGGRLVMEADGNSNQYSSLSLYNGGAGVGPAPGKIGLNILEPGVSTEFFIKAGKSVSGVVNYLTLYDSIKLRGVQNQLSPDSIVTITGGVLTTTPMSTFGAVNIYNSNGTLTADRTVQGSGLRSIKFDSMTFFQAYNAAKNGYLSITSTISKLANNEGGTRSSVLTLGAGNMALTTTNSISGITSGVSNVTDTLNFLNDGGYYRISNTISGVTNPAAIPLLVDTLTGRIYRGSPAGSVTSIAFNTATGIRSTAEPITSTGTIRIDTTIIATRAWAQSISGGGGFTGVTSVSGVNTNGFAFSIATATSTPVITLSTSITGVLKGNGTAISAATVGTDYSVGTSALATGLLKSTTATGALSIAVVNTDYVTPSVTTLSSLISVGTMTTGSISTGFIIRGVTMTLGSDASWDLYTRNASGVLERIGNGTTGQFLGANTGAKPTWQTPSVSGGVASITGTANQVIASAATGAVTLSLPQSIATTSQVTFQRGTFAGAAATANLILSSHTDPAAAAGVLTNNGTRLAFSFVTTYKRLTVTNDVAPANGQIPIGNGTDYTVAAISASNNTMVITNGAGSITVGLNMTPQTLADGATITWNAANGFNATVTLGGVGRTLTRTNWVAGATYTLRIVQDGTGSRTITTWPTGVRWPAGAAPVLSTTAGAINIVSFYFDGTLAYGAYTNAAYQ